MSSSSDTSNKQNFITPAQVNALPSRPADARLSYGPDALHFGDLRLPRGTGPHPVAVVLHGGCWVTGFADLQNTAALSDALREAGVATWNLEYRRADYPGGGWPGTFLDVAAGLDDLRRLAGDFRLDLERVCAIGHSAGGHLALWSAARPRLPVDSPLWTENPLPIRGVVALGAPGDLRRFIRRAVSVCDGPVVTRLMGGSPEEVPERYRQGSPSELLPIGAKQIFVTGAYDWVVPPEEAEAYVSVARERGDCVEHILVPDVGHHEYNVPGSSAWSTVRNAVFSALSG
jgi:acetyl esterase/lipase